MDGKPYPLGASWTDGHWNLAVYSQRPIEALVLGEFGSGRITETIRLDEQINRSGDIWHIAIPSDDERIVWGWKLCATDEIPASYIAPVIIDPYAPLLQTGNRYGANEWPHALVLIPENSCHPDASKPRDSIDRKLGQYSNISQFAIVESRELSRGQGDRNFRELALKSAILSVADRNERYEWRTKKGPPLRPKNLVLYEAHVRGMTQDPSSGVSHSGTYLGLIEKLPHLTSLGITALELLPVFEFDESENTLLNPDTGARLYNYWGYSPLSFFSPMQRYGSSPDPIQTSLEFMQLVDACHERGIAVILDVVFNHTGEGNEQGPAYSMKALAASTYYLVDESGSFMNFSGCGNTVNANHPIVTEMIIASLRHWVLKYRVDGFRFDLASALLRNQKGVPMESSPLHEAVVNDPIVGNCLLIAEPWDAAGLHQTGYFSLLTQTRQPFFLEWNDRFRDDVRDFIRGKNGTSGLFATRLCGSQDSYQHFGSPAYTINFITAHDGFSLYDLVSYDSKHNCQNGEENRDGMSDNHSWNCGHEGEAASQAVHRLRRRQAKNLLAALLLAQGTPMLLMGDEVLASKQGNNNAWCHDSPLNWMDWNRLDTHEDIMKLIRTLTAIRSLSGCFTQQRFLHEGDITWHGHELNCPRWDEANHLVAGSLKDSHGNDRIFFAFNATVHEQKVPIPKTDGDPWHTIVNTSRLPPHDCYSIDEAPAEIHRSITLSAFSSLVLYRC